MQFEYVLNKISFICVFCDARNEITDNVDKLINKEVKCKNCNHYYKIPFDYVYTYHNKNLISTGLKEKNNLLGDEKK